MRHQVLDGAANCPQTGTGLCAADKTGRPSLEQSAPRRPARRPIECEAWTKRMLGFRGPAQPSPTLGDALNAGYLNLEVRCLGCNTHQTVAFDVVRRPKATPIHELERYMRCRDCSRVRGYRDHHDDGPMAAGTGKRCSVQSKKMTPQSKTQALSSLKDSTGICDHLLGREDGVFWTSCCLDQCVHSPGRSGLYG